MRRHRVKKAFGILESSILISLISAGLVAMRGYMEKNVKQTTKNYTDSILGVERVQKSSENIYNTPKPAGDNVFYKLNPVQATQTKTTESNLFSGRTGTATREYARVSQSTPVYANKEETQTYIDFIPAKRGFIAPMRIWNVIPDDDRQYDSTIFGSRE